MDSSSGWATTSKTFLLERAAPDFKPYIYKAQFEIVIKIKKYNKCHYSPLVRKRSLEGEQEP